MFAHANALEQNTTRLQDGDLSVFIRLGSDYKNNYYEYGKTPAETHGATFQLCARVCKAVWPEETVDVRRVSSHGIEEEKP